MAAEGSRAPRGAAAPNCSVPSDTACEHRNLWWQNRRRSHRYENPLTERCNEPQLVASTRTSYSSIIEKGSALSYLVGLCRRKQESLWEPPDRASKVNFSLSVKRSYTFAASLTGQSASRMLHSPGPIGPECPRSTPALRPGPCTLPRRWMRMHDPGWNSPLADPHQ